MYRLGRLLAFAMCVFVGAAAAHADMTTVHFKDQLGNPIIDKEIIADIGGDKVLLGTTPTGSFVLDLGDGASVGFSAGGAHTTVDRNAAEISLNLGIELVVTLTVRQDNAECGEATPIGAGFEQLVSTEGAISDAFLGGQTCGTATNLGMNNGIWFSVTGTGSRLVASTCRGGNFDTQLAVFCRECSELTGIEGNDDACTGTLSQVAWDTEAGIEYMLYVTGFGDQTGSTWLSLDNDGPNVGQPEDCTPTPRGACCFDMEIEHGQEFPGCEIRTEDDCDDLGGTYQGDDTDCTAIPTGETWEIEAFPGIDIPDSGGGTISHSIDVFDNFFIADLDVDFVTDHTFVGDLEVTLHGPDGTEVVLATDPNDICSSENGADVIFNDEGPDDFDDSPPCGSSPVVGDGPPAGELSDFDGKLALGTWTIVVEDTLGADTGTLLQWSLHFDKGTSPCAGACCTDGPGTASDCIETTQFECEDENGFFVGGSCDDVDECTPLLVEMDSLSATWTRGAVAVRWATSMEIDTIGFRVLREDSGRTKSLIPVGALVPAAGHGLAGASYEVFDGSSAAATATVYWLEDIDIFGKVTRHGPIRVERAPRGGNETGFRTGGLR